MEKLDVVFGKQESDDYPYGGLRCHITFDVEFNPKKGYRYVTQTTNPKTGRVNKPKKSTYSDFICLHRDENGHINAHHINVRGYDDVAYLIEFLTLHDITFTDAQSEHMWLCVLGCIKGNLKWTKLGGGVESSQFLDALRVQRMVELFKNRANINEIKNVGYDISAICALKG